MMNVSPTVDTLVFAFFTGVSNIFFRHNIIFPGQTTGLMRTVDPEDWSSDFNL